MSSIPLRWEEASGDYGIASGEVQVWRMNLEPSGDVEAGFRAVLSADEIVRADRFIRRVHGLRFATGRGALRVLLGRYLGCTPGEIQFGYGEHGKPYLEGVSSGIDFNVSNTKAVGMIAVTGGDAVGIDVEGARERLELEKIVRRYFSTNEVEALFGLEAGLRERAFYRCWSSKEAFMKVCGKGLSMGLGNFDVEVDLAKEPAVLRVPDGMGDVGQWTMAELPMEAGVSGVLALEGTLGAVRLFELDSATLL